MKELYKVTVHFGPGMHIEHIFQGKHAAMGYVRHAQRYYRDYETISVRPQAFVDDMLLSQPGVDWFHREQYL